MPTGKQRVFVSTATENLPIEGAKVVTFDKSGRIIATQFTDADGLTDYIDLIAPERELSFSPDTATNSFTAYDIEVSKESFHKVIIHDEEIFDGENSYLPVVMHPCRGECFDPAALSDDPEGGFNISVRSEDGASLPSMDCHYGFARNMAPSSEDVLVENGVVTTVDDLDDVYVPPPAILLARQSGSVSGDAIRVREVFVPTFIVVRLGTPTNNAARNVRVPFVEYIANVASSEIFPTWPRAALEANIHAITTFALNRIYTEWYRSRGHNFDITNTTQFDQAFIYGRNIFENLLQIASEVLNVFVRRIGFQNPFFTTYRANACGSGCMSQWGSYDLARGGANTLQIIRHFYGQDTELASTDLVQDITTTFPGQNLTVGSNSRFVQLMQQHLNRIRQNFPLIPRIASENGVFGADTAAAVRVFQSINGLSQTGVIDRATWNRITQVWVGVTRLADLNSEGVRVGIGTTPPTVTLTNGSSGENVRKLQWLLNYIGTYYQIVPSDLVVDGRFGPATQNSVREFQRNFGLNPDGIVGPQTWQRLYEVFGRIQNTSPDPAPIEPPVPPVPPVPPPPGPPPLAPDRMLGTVATAGGNLNVRSNPSMTASVIDRLSNGTPVTVTGEWGGFYHISYDNGRLGWVSSDFVNITPRRGVVGTNGGNLNLRTSPSATAPVIATMPNGSEVTVMDIISGFYQINFQGRVGFASRDFITML